MRLGLRLGPDFARGALALYVLSLAWHSGVAFWFILAHGPGPHGAPLQVWGSLALLAAYLVALGDLLLPSRRGLLVAAVILTAAALLPLLVVAAWLRAGATGGGLIGVLLSMAIRVAAAAAAWHVWRRQGNGPAAH